MKFQIKVWREGIHRSKEIAGRGLVNSLEDHLEKAKELLKDDADSNQNKKLKISKIHLPIGEKEKANGELFILFVPKSRKSKRFQRGSCG